jgi:hypothetical protein
VIVVIALFIVTILQKHLQIILANRPIAGLAPVFTVLGEFFQFEVPFLSITM